MATDYEKKYNEALERAKKMMDSKRKVVVEKQALETIFPELAESEDERIRRWLCDYFSSIDKAWIHKDITCIDILRWLEKQKEQNLIMANSPQLKEQKQEKFPPYVTGFKGHPDPAGTSDLEEAAKEYASKTLCDPDDGPSTGLAKESFIAGAEWQKEQKPVEIHVDNPNIEKFDPDVKITTSDSSADGKELLYVCNKSYDIGFRDGVASVKPAEWSEEDEKDMAHIIRILDDCYVYGTHDLSKTDHENLVNKLKSLRPSWKPSESQMAMLLAVINEPNNAMAASCHLALKSLYEQLKQL